MKTKISCVFFLLLSAVLLLGCMKTKTTSSMDRTEVLKNRASKAKEQIFRLKEAASKTERAIESKLGIEVDRIEWKGSLKLENEAGLSVFVFFEKLKHLNTEQSAHIVDLVHENFGDNVFWMVAMKGDSILYSQDTRDSPPLSAESLARLGLVPCYEDICGTWVNLDYGFSAFPQRVIRSADGSWEAYDSISHEHPFTVGT